MTTAGGLDVVRFADWFVERRIATSWIEQGRAFVSPDGGLFVGVGNGHGLWTHVVATELY